MATLTMGQLWTSRCEIRIAPVNDGPSFSSVNPKILGDGGGGGFESGSAWGK